MPLLIVGLISGLLSIFAFIYGKDFWVYILIFLSTLTIRLHFSSQENYLHNWDERYHALVAKNLTENPINPVLRKDAVLPYEYTEWWGNHVWLHKQPLFLWQIALSMKIFGVNEFAVRFPSAILCALLALIIYRIGILFKRKTAGFISSLLFCFSFFSIELSTGAIGMDHNDIAATFYISASLWALIEYYKSKKVKWLILIGVFSGLAILVKWLVGLLVYACWGLCLIIYENKTTYLKELKGIVISLGITILIFLPWQIYTFIQFPTEAIYEFNFNRQHISRAVESHSGSNLFYLNNIFEHYGPLGIPMIILGLITLFISKLENKSKFLLVSIIVIPYLFFSLLSSTKTLGYVFYIAPYFIFVSTLCLDFLMKLINGKFGLSIERIALFVITISISYFAFRYETLNNFHSNGISTYNWENKAAKEHNTEIYKSLDTYLKGEYIVLNCKGMEDVEAMFYSNQNVYNWWPKENQIDSLKQEGYKIAAFTSHSNQILPDFILNDPQIIIIDMELY